MGQRIIVTFTHNKSMETPEQTASLHGHDEVISPETNTYSQIFQTTHVTVVVIDMLIKIS